MQIIMEYISQNYIALMLLAGTMVILIANRSTKIQGTQFIWAIMGIVLALTICEYTEYWCDTYNKPVWILYIKTMLVYWFYPLISLLEIYFIVTVRHKLLLAIPQAVNMTLAFINVFGWNIMYGFENNHYYKRGPLGFLPLILVCFYMILLAYYSLKLITKGNRTKGMIVIFMAVSTILTTYGQIGIEFANGHAVEIAAIDILIYYFYLAAIQHGRVQEQLRKQELEMEKMQTKLAENRLELEQSKNTLLMAQIQPHFINNSLMALRSRCSDYPEIYESITNFSRYLRSNFEALGDTRLILFELEMCNIEAYLALEQQNFKERLQVEYDIECDDFLIPALSVQPLVENAVRHGVGTCEKGGTVQINAHRTNDRIIIEVIDEGFGKSNITEQQKKRKSIGIENVRARLHSMSNGELEIISSEHGTLARITIEDIQSMGGTQ